MKFFVNTSYYKIAFISLVWFVIGILFGQWMLQANRISLGIAKVQKETAVNVPHVRTTPYVFIGGHQSSGTGLMRIQLDAHPWIRCGAEPMTTIEVLRLWSRFSQPPDKRAIVAGVYPDAINNATKAFIEETIEHMGPDAKVLCHKEPTTFRFLGVLGRLFPKAKFIHMVRDGRGAVASSMVRGLVQRNQPQGELELWQKGVTHMLNSCAQLGPEHCINVRYESLILRTEKELRRILEFIGVPWDPIVLHHEQILDQLTNLSPFEPSTKQFRKPVHNASFATWNNASSPIAIEVRNKSCLTIPLLKTLDYCPPTGYVPNYESIPAQIRYP